MLPKVSPRILIVGVCASGKSTLAKGLRQLGYDAGPLAQEHSVTPRLWARRHPDILIALECRYETTVARRRARRWTIEHWEEQRAILKDAVAHAQIRICTDDLTPAELVDGALKELIRLGAPPPWRVA